MLTGGHCTRWPFPPGLGERIAAARRAGRRVRWPPRPSGQVFPAQLIRPPRSRFATIGPHFRRTRSSTATTVGNPGGEHLESAVLAGAHAVGTAGGRLGTPPGLPRVVAVGDSHDERVDLWLATCSWGSLIVGAILGLTVAAATYATAGAARRGDPLAQLWERASDPYLPFSITAWEFARGKLRGDPLYRATAATGLLRNGRTLVDVGCGQGLTLSVLVHASRLWAEGRWPAEARRRRNSAAGRRSNCARVSRRLAQQALGPAVEVLSSDARDVMPPEAAVVLFFDVLHLMPPEDQERLIDRANAALSPGGMILIREVDPAGGWRFTAVRLGNRLKSIVVGQWGQRFHFRTVHEWTSLLTQHGLQVAVSPMGEGTPFANLLVRGVRSADHPALDEMAHVDNRRGGNTRRGIEFTAEPERAGDG